MPEGSTPAQLDIEELADDKTPVAEVMYEGPTTVRPAEEVDGLLHRMRHADVGHIVVTRSDGVLLGILEAEVAVADHDAHAHP